MKNSIQVEKNSTATEYEPYGKVWYLKKEIAKVVLDGSETSWSRSATKTSGNYYFLIYNAVSNCLFINDKFIGLSNIGVSTSAYQEGQGTDTIWYNSQPLTRVYTEATKNMTVADFQSWLLSNNVIVYYALATPTYTKITDTTLLEQLNRLEQLQSYNNQTNIFQENNDLGFIINAVALKEIADNA
jgi:hypothetical protein